RQVPLPGAAAGARRAPAAPLAGETLQALLRAGAFRREPLPDDEAAFVFFGAAVFRSCASATLRRSASIRSITGVSATGSGRLISWPASLASSIARSAVR